MKHQVLATLVEGDWFGAFEYRDDAAAKVAELCADPRVLMVTVRFADK